MSRIPLVSVAEMTEEQHAQYDRFPSNLTRALLLMDPRLAGALPNLANALRASRLKPAFARPSFYALRLCRAAPMNGCSTWSRHTRVAGTTTTSL